MKKGLIPKDPFAGYKMSRETVNRDALTEQELKTVMNKDFKNDRLNQVRDIFVFCCYTGLAYINVDKLSRKEIIEGYGGEKWLVINR